jgi:hypothetical protein
VPTVWLGIGVAKQFKVTWLHIFKEKYGSGGLLFRYRRLPATKSQKMAMCKGFCF